jgi:hypothetical protein
MLFSMIVAPRMGLFFGLYWIKKNLGIGFDMKSSFLIYTSAGSAMGVGFIILSFFQLHSWSSLFVVTPIFILLYSFLLLAIGGITKRDLQELASIANLGGPLTPFIKRILQIARDLCRFDE